MISCCQCGAKAPEASLQRTNFKGEEGIWACMGTCWNDVMRKKASRSCDRTECGFLGCMYPRSCRHAAEAVAETRTTRAQRLN